MCIERVVSVLVGLSEITSEVRFRAVFKSFFNHEKSILTLVGDLNQHLKEDGREKLNLTEYSFVILKGVGF
jgi:hypothetical protein